MSSKSKVFPFLFVFGWPDRRQNQQGDLYFFVVQSFYESQPDKLASSFFANVVRDSGFEGRCCGTGPFFQPQLVFRVSMGSALQGNVPGRNWVTVGYIG